MAYSISLTKRTNGGYTIVTESATFYPSDILYHGTTVGVVLYSRGVVTNLYKPTEWTIQTVTGYTTVAQVCDALDALGITSADPLLDIKALLTSIDSDTGNVLLDTNAIKTALQVLDNIVSGNEAQVDVITLPALPSGTNTVGKVGIDQVTANANEVVVKSGAVTEASASDIKTAVQLIDDTVKTLGTDTFAEATTKGLVIGAVRRDAETTAVDTTNEISPLVLDAYGRLKVSSQGRTTSPTVLIGTGSAQNVTTGWVDHGAEVATNGAHIFDLWVAVVHTNSVNVRVRILGKHTATTGTEFQIPIKNISSDVVKVLGHYYELDSDATQNILLDWDVSGVPYVQVQIQCETVGAVADTVSSDYTLMF